MSCSADRQALAKITAEGVFLEQLETDPARFLPETTDEHLRDDDVVRIDLNRPMDEIRAELTKYPVKTRLSLTGPLVVARDIAHAKIKERLDAGEEMPQYLRTTPVYYAGPAKTPEGYASGSFGPTTAGRMDSYVEQFQAAGGSMVMLAKGNRSQQVTDACAAHGGFYLGSIGGPAARLAQDCIKKVEVARVRRSSAWRRSGRSRSRTSRRSSWSTTRATTSSRTRPRPRPSPPSRSALRAEASGTTTESSRRVRRELSARSGGSFPFRKSEPLASAASCSQTSNVTLRNGSLGGSAVKVTKLVSTCDVKDCPTIYATDRGTLLVQGEAPTDHGLTIPGHETVVEIPAELVLDLVRKGLGV